MTVIDSQKSSRACQVGLLIGLAMATTSCSLASTLYDTHEQDSALQEESDKEYAEFLEKASVLNEPALMADIKLLKGKIIAENTPGVYDFNCLITYSNAQKNRDKGPGELSSYYETCVERCEYGSENGDNKALSAKYNKICTKLNQEVVAKMAAAEAVQAIASSLERMESRYGSFLNPETTAIKRHAILARLLDDLGRLKKEFPENQEIAAVVDRYENEIEKQKAAVARADSFLKTKNIVSLFAKREKLKEDLATLQQSVEMWEKDSEEQKMAKKMVKARLAKIEALNKQFDKLAKKAKVL